MKTRTLTKDEYQLYVIAQLAAEDEESYFPMSTQELNEGRKCYVVDEQGRVSSKN